jgi:alpha-tubulin suppressor-like RCC1 family protein
LNRNGRLGDGTTVDRATPTQESTETTNWSAIAAGNLHTVALKPDGTFWAWGYNPSGELGDGTNTQRNIPIQSAIGTEWTAAFTLASKDVEGTVTFTINFSDTDGNAGVQATATTDSS